MLKLLISRKYPFVNLVDIGLRRQVDQLKIENEELRARLIAAQQEKAVARQQTEEFRSQKERLRVKIVTLKQETEAQRRVRETLEAKIQTLREENEALSMEHS
jgi:chromosome segregation ATPase